ncbi:MAG: oligosaccharide flippase family protein [Erysipelotrichaceae bacterium]|nr:oligosaccharide flippase family protein [Erysipelotrichaceae bacterium]
MINNLKNRWKTFSPAAKASIVLMVSQVIQKGLSVITSPIYTRLLTTDEYGQVSLFFSWYEILIIFTGLCLSKGVFNNGMMDFKNDRDRFSWSLYILALVSTIIAGAVVTLFCVYINNFLDLPLYLIIYMFILLAFEEGYSLWVVRQRFEYKYKATFFASIIIAVVSPICGILAIILFKSNHIAARIIGARNVFVIVYIFAIITLMYRAKAKIKISYWKYALKFNIPLIPHYLSLHILNHMDRIMISSIINASAAGIYSVAYSGSSLIKVFWQAINASLIPWTYEKCEKGQFKELNALTQIIVSIYAYICICFMVLAPEIMRILAPSSYESGIYVIPSVTAGVFFSSMYYIFANVIYYYKKPKYVMYSSCFAAIANIILNYIFISKYGFLAAGYTTLFCYILQTIFDYFAMRIVVKEQIYDMKPLIGISFVIVMFSLIMSFLYDKIIIRYTVFIISIIIIGISLMKNKDKIFAFLKTKKK